MQNMDIRVEVIRHDSFIDTSISYVHDFETGEIFGQVMLPPGQFIEPAELSELMQECKDYVVSQHVGRPVRGRRGGTNERPR
jgi:hypothetical protein